jgi:hypothetical protein
MMNITEKKKRHLDAVRKFIQTGREISREPTQNTDVQKSAI